MMVILEHPLIKLYLTLIGWVLVGFLLGRKLPQNAAPRLGKFLFWIGVPISIVAFMRRTNLSSHILIAPVTAWIAILFGALLAWVWIDLELSDERLKSLAKGLEYKTDIETKNAAAIEANQSLPAFKTAWSRPTQGSFLLSMMVGNTAYLGYPVVLSLVGPQYFVWALLYNTLGTALGVYGLGTTLAAQFGNNRQSQAKLWKIMLQNPALWSFGVGWFIRNLPLSDLAEQGLQGTAWSVVNLSIVLIGMQLSKLTSLGKLRQAWISLVIKMVLVPLVVGTGLMFFGVTGPQRMVLVLQMAMPPAFNIVLFAEAYKLDRDLAVTAVAFGFITLLFTIPVWLWLFS